MLEGRKCPGRVQCESVESDDLIERTNHRCGDGEYPGVYVNVPNYRQWIDDRL